MKLPSKPPIVSIIIPMYNKYNMTYDCITSIYKNTQENYEIIIADDCSTDLGIHKLSNIENIKIVRTPINYGFLKNCNNAAQYAVGEYLLFLNNDTEVTPNWLLPLISIMQDSTVGIVGSKLLNTNGTLQEAGGVIYKGGSAWNYGRGGNPNDPEFNYVKEVDYISGACLMIRRSLWNMLQGFDTHYVPAYCEDTDIAFRARENGYKVVYQPKSVVYHHEGQTHGKDTNIGIKKFQIVNNTKFKIRWEHALQTHRVDGDYFNQRDRSINKETILIIDHYVPSFDQDAGGKTVYQYIKTLLAMGFNVKLVGANFAPKAQVEQHCDAFEQMGVEVLYGPKYNIQQFTKWLEQFKNHINYVLINRPHIANQFIPIIRGIDSYMEILYYGHDLHHVRELRKYAITKNPNTLTEANKWKHIEFTAMRNSNYILSLSEEEKSIVLENLPNAKVTVVPPYVYFDKKKHITNFYNRKGIFFIGGFRHVPNVDAVEWFVSNIWSYILEHNKDIKFYIAGSYMPDNIKKLHGITNIEILGQLTEKELDDIYDKVRMVVVPLRYGAGVKGKVVDSMYRGLPIVSTTIGIEGLPNIETIYKPQDTPMGFAKAVLSLYENIKELESISLKSVDYIQQYFSYKRIEEIFTELLKSGNPQLIMDIIKDRPGGYLDPLGKTIVGYLNLSKNSPEQPLNTMFEALDSLGEEIIFEIVMSNIASLNFPTFKNIRIIKTELPTSNILNWAKSNLFWDMVVLPATPEDFTEYMCCSLLSIPSVCSTVYRDFIIDKENGILTDDYAYGVKQLIIDKYLRLYIMQNLNANNIIKNNLGVIKRKLL